MVLQNLQHSLYLVAGELKDYGRPAPEKRSVWQAALEEKQQEQQSLQLLRETKELQ